MIRGSPSTWCAGLTTVHGTSPATPPFEAQRGTALPRWCLLASLWNLAWTAHHRPTCPPGRPSIHAPAQSNALADAYARIHTHKHKRGRRSAHRRTRTHTCARVHTHTHTHTHADTTCGRRTMPLQHRPITARYRSGVAWRKAGVFCARKVSAHAVVHI